MSQPSPPFPELMISGKRKLPLSDNRGSVGHLWVPIPFTMHVAKDDDQAAVLPLQCTTPP